MIDDRRQEPLLDLALNAVIEALRMAPDRYAIIYNNQYDDNHNTAAATLSYSPKLYQTYYNDYREGILEIAKAVFNSLSNQLVNKTMVTSVKGAITY